MKNEKAGIDPFFFFFYLHVVEVEIFPYFFKKLRRHYSATCYAAGQSYRRGSNALVHVQQSDLKKKCMIERLNCILFTRPSNFNTAFIETLLYPHSRCPVNDIALLPYYRVQRFLRIEGAGLEHDRDSGMKHAQQTFDQAVHVEEWNVQANLLPDLKFCPRYALYIYIFIKQTCLVYISISIYTHTHIYIPV